ncbi:MAG TPA: PTS sugar transporter, partial [Clostridiaceae bacterium]|nr:PTS sugar transporter [Clostridiaceae bacterium]
MSLLTNRQKQILLFLTKFKGILTAKRISEELGVSDKTVRNDIKVLQGESQKIGAKIQSISGKGYKLEIINAEQFLKFYCQSFDKDKEISNDFTDQDNRVNYIIKRFLLAKGYIKMEDLENEMFVSKSTLRNDLKIVRQILDSYELNIINRPYYGTKIEGDEYMKRMCLSNLLLDNSTNMFTEYNKLQSYDKDLFNKIKDIAIKKLKDYQIEISDVSLDSLAKHIAIACKRIKEGFIIGSLNIHSNIECTFEKNVAKEIVKEVESYTNLKFPETEIDYITVQLLCTKLLSEKAYTEYSGEISKIVDDIIEQLREKFHWDFRNNFEFIQGLTLHLRPAVNRILFQFHIKNPLLDEIKLKCPRAFEGAIVASKCIESYIHKEVDMNETAYIALHIEAALERMEGNKSVKKRVLVVCATGMGSAKILYNRLQKVFGDHIEIVDTISCYNLESYDLSSIDMIISTIPIEDKWGVPVQKVDIFLSDKDVKGIKEKLFSNKVDMHLLLNSSRVFIHKDINNKKGVIQYLCSELEKQGLVSHNYESFVLERENVASTSFENLVALPHPMKLDT